MNIGFHEYNDHKSLRYITDNILAYLMKNNEIIWKLLKYQSPDALLQPNLTLKEKKDLIYTGWVLQDGKYVLERYEDKAVFRQPWIDEADYEQTTMLRIFLSRLIPQNKVTTTALYTFEVVCHNKSISIVSNLGDEDNEVSVNTENRLELIVQQILETLNGAQIGSIGRIFFDMDGSYMTKGDIGVYNNRNYYGFKLIMGCMVNGTK